MKVTIDPEADALYMRLSDTRISDTEEVKPGLSWTMMTKITLSGSRSSAYQNGCRRQP